MKTNTIFFREGSGVPVVMLHSSMSSKEQWFKLAANLSSDFDVIAIDLSGYGKSSYPQNPSSFSLFDEAVRIDEIVRDLIGDDKFHFVGHSYGGATALRLTYDKPDRILSLSLYEPVAFHLLEKTDPALMQILEVVENIHSCIDAMNFSEATRIFVDCWSGEGTYNRLGQKKQTMLDCFIKKVSLDFQAGIYDPLTLGDYRRISVPTCLITSPQSPLPTRQIVANLEKTLPHIQTHRVDGGHMAPITNAIEVNLIWQTFIRAI